MGIEGLPVGMRDFWQPDWAIGHGHEQLVETSLQMGMVSPSNSAVAYIAPVIDVGTCHRPVTCSSWRAHRQSVIADADIAQSYDQPWWLDTNALVSLADAHIWSVRPDGSERFAINGQSTCISITSIH